MQILMMFALVALLIGLSKGGLGGPVPVSMTAPLLSLVIPISQAVGVVLPLLLFADIFALYFYWQKWDERYIRLMLPLGIVGAIVGSLLLAGLSNEVLRRVIGAFTLIAVIYKVMSDQLPRFQYVPRQWHGWLAGGAAGFGSALANAGAPPFTAYMLLQPNMQPLPFIGTTTLFFAIINLLKLPFFLGTGVLNVPLLLQMLWVLPIIPLGVWTGRYIVRTMNPRRFEQMMLVMLALLSVWLLVG
jgi:hypothetical protein